MIAYPLITDFCLDARMDWHPARLHKVLIVEHYLLLQSSALGQWFEWIEVCTRESWVVIISCVPLGGKTCPSCHFLAVSSFEASRLTRGRVKRDFLKRIPLTNAYAPLDKSSITLSQLYRPFPQLLNSLDTFSPCSSYPKSLSISVAKTHHVIQRHLECYRSADCWEALGGVDGH